MIVLELGTKIIVHHAGTRSRNAPIILFHAQPYYEYLYLVVTYSPEYLGIRSIQNPQVEFNQIILQFQKYS
jgi:hypothetical protein